VISLLAKDGKAYGVTVRHNDTEEVIECDWICDCSGRNNSTNTDNWLKQFGITIPRDEIDNGMTYATSVCIPPAHLKEEFKSEPLQYMSVDFGENLKLSCITPIENGNYIFLISTYGRLQLPTTKEEVIKFYQVPNHEYFAKQLSVFEEVSPFKLYASACKCLCKHPEKISNWLDNYVMLGDSIACFNPTFGQGMTQASCHVMEMHKVFLEHISSKPYVNLDGISKIIQKRAAINTSEYWMASTSEDLNRSTTVGKRSFLLTQFSQFFHYLIQHLLSKNKIDELFIVTGGLKGLETLLTFDALVYVLPKFIASRFQFNSKKNRREGKYRIILGRRRV